MYRELWLASTTILKQITARNLGLSLNLLAGPPTCLGFVWATSMREWVRMRKPEVAWDRLDRWTVFAKLSTYATSLILAMLTLCTLGQEITLLRVTHISALTGSWPPLLGSHSSLVPRAITFPCHPRITPWSPSTCIAPNLKVWVLNLCFTLRSCGYKTQDVLK